MLEPSSKWSVDFDKDKCRLIRLFGPETARNVLILEQYAPGEYFSLALAGPAFETIKWSVKGNMVRFIPDRPHTMQEALVGPLDGYGRALYFRAINLDGPDKTELKRPKDAPPEPPSSLDPSLGAEVRFVEVGDGSNQVRLMTGPIDRPIKVMNECLLDLIGSWGLDSEQHRTMTRAAQPRDIQKALNDIYGRIPWERLTNTGEMAVIRLRLITGTNGEVESCALPENTDPKIETETCKGAARIQIDPALDAVGEPMRSYWTFNIFVTETAPQFIRLPG
jgi:hypothetical protein